MYDIKYFFSIKIIRQSRGRNNNFLRETNYRKSLFIKIQRETVAPLDPIGSTSIYWARKIEQNIKFINAIKINQLVGKSDG
jgi:hypothetical protein